MAGRRVAIIILTALLAAVSGCEVPRARSPADVLLVTIDTLRADRWGCTGDPAARTPVVDRLARGGLLAFEGRAPAPVTLPSHTTILTGVPPQVHGVRDNGIFALSDRAGATLAEAFRAAGWSTGALVSAFPLAARFGLERGFDHYDAFLGEAGGSHLRERRAEVTVRRTRRWLRGPKAPPRDRPLFAWVHFFDPHAPYDAPAPFPRAVSDAYRGEVAYSDHQLGRLLEVFAQDRNRPLRVVVVSDHGEALGAHGEPSHGLLVHLETMRVPIVVWDGGGRAELLAAPVGLEHIAATVLALAGLDAGLDPGAAEPLDASSPAGPVLGETLYPWFNHGWRGLRVFEHGGWRLIEGERSQLFARFEDPGEQADVSEARPAIVEDMRASLHDAWSSRRAVAWVPEERKLSPEEAEALRALGYAGGGVESTVEAGFESGVDPADRLAEVVRTNAAIAALEAGDAAGAARRLEDVVRVDPSNRMAAEYLGRARLASGDPAGAREAIRLALSLGPNPETVWLDLAAAEASLGDLAAEEEALLGALAAGPTSVQARVRLATLLAERGEVDEALALLVEAARIRPKAVGPHVTSAQICESLGRWDEAVEHWERVLALEPGDPLDANARQSIDRLHTEGKGG